MPVLVAPASSNDTAGQATAVRRGLGPVPVVLICFGAFLASIAPNEALTWGLALAALAVLATGRVPRIGVVEVLTVSVATWATVTLLWTVDDVSSEERVRAYWAVGLLLIAIRHVVITKRTVVGVAAAYLTGCVCVAGRLIYDAAVGAERVAQPAVNINYSAYSLASGVVVAALLFALSPTWRAKVVIAAAGAGLVLATVVTGTRGAIVALVLIGVYLVAAQLSVVVAWAMSITATVTLLVAVPFGWLNLAWAEGYFARDSGDLSGRLTVWPIAVHEWSHSLLTGVGAGAFPYLNPYRGIGPHSLVLSLGLDLGLIGLVLYAALLVAVLGAASRGRGRFFAGMLIIAWLPMWLTGHWEISTAAWVILGLWSRLPAAVR